MQERTFDLMRTDLKMPEMSREELLEQVRTTWPDLEVIIVTAYPGLSNAIHTTRAGISDYVLKPFDLNQLELAVRCGIERKQLRLALQHEQQLRHQSEALRARLKLRGANPYEWNEAILAGERDCFVVFNPLQ